MAKNAVAKAWSLPVTDGRYYSNPGDIPTPGERFYVTHSVESPITLQRIGPQSREEILALSSSGSAHFEQSASADIGEDTLLPLEYIGGRWPFDYVVTSDIPGIEVVYGGRSGGVPPFLDYIRIPSGTAVGEYEITALCVDQNDTVVTEIAFDHEIFDEDDTDNVGWVNPGHADADNSNDGSRAAPWLSIEGWYGSGLSDSTHRNKIIYYEDVGVNAGNGINIGARAYNALTAYVPGSRVTSGGIKYLCIAATTGNAPPNATYWVVSTLAYQSNDSRLRLNDSKPKCHRFLGDVPIHGNGACWDLQAGTGWSFTGDAIHDDAQYFEAVTVPPEDGIRIQWFRGGGNRLKHGRIGMGYTASAAGTYSPAEGSNSSVYEFPDNSGTPVWGFSFPGLIVDGVGSDNEMWSILKNNNTHGILIHGLQVRNCSHAILIHHKGVDIDETEERGCIAIENNSDCQFRDVQWILNFVQRHKNTYCWNNYDTATDPPVLAGGSGGGTFLQGAANDDYENQAGWCNNERVAFHWSAAESGVLTLTRNVRIHNGTYTDGVRDTGAGTVSAGDGNDEYTSTNVEDLDATTNLLAGAARAAQLGLAGCEMVEDT